MVQSKKIGKVWEKRGKREDEKVGSEGRREGRSGTCARGGAHESRSESPDNHQASKFNWYSLREF